MKTPILLIVVVIMAAIVIVFPMAIFGVLIFAALAVLLGGGKN